MNETATTSFRLFIARVAAVFGIAALALFSGYAMARAQDAAEDEAVFDEEFVDGEEAFDVEALDEEAAVEEGEAVTEDEGAATEDESASADATADEGGFFSAVGDFFGDVKDAAVGAYDAATDFLGLGDEEEEAEAPAEEAEVPAAPLPATVPIPEDVDVAAPTDVPKSNPFVLRVQIVASDVAAMLRSTRESEAIRYEPRSFEIPDRGLVTLRASQDGPLFCLAFDISEFRVAAALDAASFAANDARGATEKGENANTACVGLPSLSALSRKAPLSIEATFK